MQQQQEMQRESGIGSFLFLHGYAGPGAEVVTAIDRDPGLYRFKVLKQHAAIDRQIADDGKFGKRFQAGWAVRACRPEPSRPYGRDR